MKILIIIILSFPVSCMACDKFLAGSYVKDVEEQLLQFEECSDKDCMENKIRTSEKLLCEAQKECEELSSALSNPCDHEMLVDKDSMNTLYIIAPLHFSELVASAKKHLEPRAPLISKK